MSKGYGPVDWASIAARKNSGRAQRRAQAARERKLSIPAAKAIIRRNNQRKGGSNERDSSGR